MTASASGYRFGLFVLVILSLVSWLGVVINFDPWASGPLAIVLFFLTLFFFLTAFFALLGLKFFPTINFFSLALLISLGLITLLLWRIF